MMIVDAHLDLAYNALNYDRDLRLNLADLRATEPEKSPRGRATVTLPELMRGEVGLVFGTLFVEPASSKKEAFGGKMVYRDAAEANALAMAQLDYYHRLADELENLRLVGDQESLQEVVASHEAGDEPLLGIVPLMEGADPVRRPEELELWYERGLRLIGLAWENTRYSAGAWHGGNAGLTPEGVQLLEAMADYSFILDLTHMSERATYEALDRYEGPVVATHCNARVLVPTERQLSDAQIRRLGEREGVIGIVLANGFLRANHRMTDAKELVTLDHVVAHLDHICQVLGDSTHIGIGSDMDGGFGAEHIPMEMDSIADLDLIASKLAERGYEAADIANIMRDNWLRLLRRTLV